MRGRVLGESMLYVIIQWVIRITLIFSVPTLYLLGKFEMDYRTWEHRYQLHIILLGWVILCVLLWAVYGMRKENIWVQGKLHVGIGLKVIIISLITGVGLNLFINGFLWLLPLGDLFPEYGRAIENVLNHPFYETLLFTGILIPIMEEVFYRGVILGKLRQGFSITGAILIQAIFFGIGHMNIVQGLYALVMGIVFGYVVMWTRSLYCAILLHITINTTSIIWQQVVKTTLSEKELTFIILVGALLTILGLYMLSNEEEDNHDQVVDMTQ